MNASQVSEGEDPHGHQFIERSRRNRLIEQMLGPPVEGEIISPEVSMVPSRWYKGKGVLTEQTLEALAQIQDPVAELHGMLRRSYQDPFGLPGTWRTEAGADGVYLMYLIPTNNY